LTPSSPPNGHLGEDLRVGLDEGVAALGAKEGRIALVEP